MRAHHILITLLVMASLSGCLSDDGDDDAQEPTDTDTGDDDNMTSPPPTTVDLSVALAGAYPVNIAYDPATLTVENNTLVNLTFTNNDQAPIFSHDWVLEGVEGAATEVIANGASDTISFMAPAPGTYAFFCSVQGHRENGMEGQFTVNA